MLWDTLRWMRTVMWTGLQVAVCVGVCLALQRESPMQAATPATGTGVQTLPVSQMVTTLVPLIVDGAPARLPVRATHILTQGHADVTRVIIVIHGALRNAEGSFTTMQHSMTLAGEAGRHVLIVAPQFLSEVDTARYPIPLDVPVWSVDGWKEGDLSEIRRDDSTDRRVSSFAVLDALLQMLSDRQHWPALNLVVLAGHSAGGQFVQRYAVAGRAPTLLSHHGIHTRFVIANPSSYLYFDERRPTEHGFAPFPQTQCRGFDHYKYGLKAPNAYVVAQTPQALMSRYARQQVIYLLGTLDADAAHPFLDRSCAAEAQGPTRLARGQAYYQYLPLVLGHEVVQRQHRVLIEGVGHDHQRMFQSPCGVAWLFANGQCPQPPGTSQMPFPKADARISVPSPER
jgi:pimeloyl-ACP methyl ester carboxylesterase